MSYVVLARKYRPMRFADMVGQEHIGRTLGNAIKQDRVHHAYLFSGARGLGKTTTARIFAKGLVCETGPTAEPCNECSECVAVSEGRSVDVMEIDGASNNSVDNIRNLREQVNYLPQTARRKVYIIDEVHMLTTSAFNALLKTLEEPPPHVNFVFATTEPQKVLPTILSRVNRLDFKRVAPGALVDYLRSILDREGLAVEPGGLRIVARAGGGSVRDALTLLDQVIAFAEDSSNVGEQEVRRLLGQADASATFDLVGAILRRDPTQTMQRFDAMVTAGNDLGVLSLQVLELLRDLTLVKVCDTPAVLPDATDSELEQLRALAAEVSPSHLGQLFDRFSRVIDRLPHSRSQRLLMEMGLLDLACAEPVMPLGDLVEQLQALGRGAAPSTGGGGRSGGAARGAARGRGSEPGRGDPGFRADDTAGRPPAPPAPSDAPAPAPAIAPASAERGPRPETPASRSAAFQPRSIPPFEDQPPAPVAPAPVAPASLDATPPRGDNAPPTPGVTFQPRSVPPFEDQPPAPVAPAVVTADPVVPTPAVSPSVAPAPSDLGANSFTAKLLTMGLAGGMVIDEEDDGGERRPPSTPPADGPSSSAPEGRPATASPPEIRAGAGPCLPPPPADGVIPWEELSTMEAWEQLVDRIRQADEFLAAVLGEVGLVSLGGGTLKVAAPRGSFAYTELTRHPQMRAQVEQACRDHLGAPFTIELVEGEPVLPDLPSLVLIAQQRRAEHRAAVEAEALANPGIQALLSTFDATLVGTKPIQEP